MHTPVLTEKVLEYLALQPGEHVIDCTAGGGGHTAAILERTAPKGKVLAIDWDREALERLKAQSADWRIKIQNRLVLHEGNFADITEIVNQKKFRPVHKILLDLGFSSDQLEERGRGFSFQKTEPLDMRYSERNPTTAEKIVNYQSRVELEHILKEYSEEQFAKQIASTIVESRKQKPIRTTTQLVAIIELATPKFYQRKKIHPATKTFQALRIATNNELGNLKQVLKETEVLLESKGRIAVLSFHSLEDRIVKQFFQESQYLRPIHKKPITPTRQEVKVNPRARSAKLRVAEKQ